jgi:transposase
MTKLTFAPVPAAAAVDYDSTVIVVVEISERSWVVGAQIPGVDRARKPKRTIAPNAAALFEALDQYRRRAAEAGYPVTREIVAYEAGYSGFWLARALRERGCECYVIHPSSVPVSRPQRRAKTDRIDVDLLLRTLLAWLRGEPRACSMAPIPSLSDEDARQAVREREDLVGRRTALSNQIKSLLATQGVTGYQPRKAGRRERLAELRGVGGAPLPAHLEARLGRLLDQLDLVERQIGVLEVERDAVVRRVALERKAAAKDVAAKDVAAKDVAAKDVAAKDVAAKDVAEWDDTAPRTAEPVAPASPEAMIADLVKVKRVGVQSATLLVREVFVRPVGSGRALGAYAGLTGTPYNSGGQEREQGISKAGNRRVRAAMVELAWLWPRFQPGSALARWYAERTRGAKGRMRKILIVALARKLLVALWRYATQGVVPDGAEIAA